MKKSMLAALLIVFLVGLAGVPALYAETQVSEVYGEPGADYSDPSAFEGDAVVPGQRAPENPPALDMPTEAGVEID